MEDKMEKIISLAKRRGFVYQSSEIYGGTGSVWDYGHLGVLLKQNLKQVWWKRFVQKRMDVVGIEGSILMHPRVWEASGHLENFVDPLVECKKCHARFREDHMREGNYVGQGKAKEINQCPDCGALEFTASRQFNMMFKTFMGPVEDSAHVTYLRPETAQSMFTDFKLVMESARKKLPFGIAQIGKSFRNEITPGNFIFRTREFEIGEIEYFVKPGTDEEIFEEWFKEWWNFYTSLGLKEENMRAYDHPKEKLAHYSKGTRDIEYNFPFGWSELAGVANRTDYDLSRHQEFSGKDLTYFDEEEKRRYVPYVIEPTMGIDRTLLVFLVDAFEEIQESTQEREKGEIILRLHPLLAPIKAAILPLVKKDKLPEIAKQLFDELSEEFMVQYDETGSIGRRYRRQDEIGTPYCLTVDFDTIEDQSITIRDRDTMKQERVLISKVKEWLTQKIR